jgi:hypothetical protein
MKSRFLKKWAMITLNGSEGHFKCFIEKVGLEANQEVYYVKYEDGTCEPIFLSSVFRIWAANQKKATVIKFPLKIDNRLRLVK